MRKLAFFLSAGLVMPSIAQATDEVAGSFEVVDIKMCSGVENKEAVDTITTVNTGERVWVWLKLRPKSDTATLTMKWSWDGNDVWTMDATPVKLGRTWYYKTIDQPGEWKVDLVDEGGNVIKSASITATGDPVYKKAEAPAAGESAAEGVGESAAASVGESDHVAVIELKLSEEIKDRDPVTPGSSFTKGAKVYTWVKLNVKAPETSIKMKWYVEDALVYTSDAVTVKQSPGWRTWLYKTVDVTGNWKVEVVDADDKAVHQESFSVQ